MSSNPPMPLALCLAAFAAYGTSAAAQPTQSTPPVASHDAWTVFVADTPKECYLTAAPETSVARRDGKSVAVDRGEIRLFVTFRPGENVTNEVSFASGYPLRDDSAVKVAVGSTDFELTMGPGADDGWAWPASPEVDARLVEAMRRGAKAEITGVSARGTTTVDTFSLAGFTAAVNDAEARCK